MLLAASAFRQAATILCASSRDKHGLLRIWFFEERELIDETTPHFPLKFADKPVEIPRHQISHLRMYVQIYDAAGCFDPGTRGLRKG
jgi:hypothetical protein